jgi:hypothetical protein
MMIWLSVLSRCALIEVSNFLPCHPRQLIVAMDLHAELELYVSHVTERDGERRPRPPRGSKVMVLVNATARKLQEDGHIAVIRVKGDPSTTQNLRL